MTEQWNELKETIIELRDSDGTGTQQEVCKFLANYMNVLEEQMQEPCEDAISRQAVLETIDNRIEQLKRDVNEINKSYSHLSFAEGVHDGYCRLKCDLRILPSVTPQPKTGHWIKHEHNGIGHIECSECLCWFLEAQLLRNSYCPNCGAKMIESQESEE